MACVHLASGHLVLSEADFAAWWDERRELRGAGISFADALRQEVARRLDVRNFRQLAVVSGEQALGPGSPWSNAGPLVAVVRQYVADEAAEGAVSELFHVAGSGDLAQVISLLERPLDPNACNDRGKSALHVAALSGHADIARCLLQSGAEADKANDDGHTPLQISAFTGHGEVSRCLLEAGADMDRTDRFGTTPMLEATTRGDLQVVRCMLEAGADKNKADSDGIAPMHVAARKGHQEIARCLLEAGAEKDQANANGRTPMHAAARKGHLEVVQHLLEAAGSAFCDMQYITKCVYLYLYLQLYSCDLTVGEVCFTSYLRLSTKAGADTDKVDSDGRTALHDAASFGHFAVVRCLVEAGADKRKADHVGRLPIQEAANRGHRELCALLG